MGTKVTVSSESQIAVPAEIRRRLNIKSGDRLICEVMDGIAVLLPEPQDYNKRLGGLHAEI